MPSITVHLTDGTKKHFPETSRPGGSWRTTYSTSDGWIIVRDAYGNETLFPCDKVEMVELENTQYY